MKNTSYLDSSVGTWFQYLRSSIPVIDNPLADTDKHTLPMLLSNQTFYSNNTKTNQKKKKTFSSFLFTLTSKSVDFYVNLLPWCLHQKY